MHWHGLSLVWLMFLIKVLLILGWNGEIWVFVICWCFSVCCHCILDHLSSRFHRFWDLWRYKLYLLLRLTLQFRDHFSLVLSFKLFNYRLLLLFWVIRHFIWLTNGDLRTDNLWWKKDLWLLLELDSASCISINYYSTWSGLCYLTAEIRWGRLFFH